MSDPHPPAPGPIKRDGEKGDEQRVSASRSLYLGERTTGGGKLTHNLILFGRVCRALGMNVTPNRMMDVARALAFIQLGRKQDFYYTLRTHLVAHPKEFAYFDQAFELFWRRPSEGFTTLNLQSLGEERLKKKTQFLPPLESRPGEEGDAEGEIDPGLIALVPTYSQQERLRHKDFAEMTADELEMAKRVISKMPESLGMRRTRRFQNGKGRLINTRRLMKDVIRKQGRCDAAADASPQAEAAPGRAALRYQRQHGALHPRLAALHAYAGGLAFPGRIPSSTARISRASRARSARRMWMMRWKISGRLCLQWGGGTMTGECMHRFNWAWSRRVLGRGAVVMLITDGWDRGDIPLLHREMERLRASCRRLIWLNPLLDVPEYEPLTRGAQAILPYAHDFLPITNLANLEVIVKALNNLNAKSSAEVYRKRYLA